MAEQRKEKETDIKEKLLEKHHEAKLVRRIVFIVFIILMLSLTALVAGGYSFVKNSLQPVDETAEETTVVEIPIGSSVTAIGNILEESGIVHNAKIFRYYVKFKNESGFQAGEYALSPAMTLDDIIEELKQGKIMQEVVFQVTIPEGRQLTEIATILSNRANVNEEEFLETVNDPAFVEKMMARFPVLLTEEILAEDVMYPLEGYLFPATYPFYEENPSIETIVETMLIKTQEVVIQYSAEMEEKEMTIHDVLTMASLIEEEATAQTDRENISSVFYNRLETGMPLQTDPTIAYALGEHLDRTLFVHLEVESPYNTYKYPGLTPGPIANAGETSIIAALRPAETDYFYFLATPDGKVLFNRTLEEHNRDRATHITGSGE